MPLTLTPAKEYEERQKNQIKSQPQQAQPASPSPSGLTLTPVGPEGAPKGRPRPDFFDTGVGRTVEGLSNFGIGMGTKIGKAGLGLGELFLRGADKIPVGDVSPAIEAIQDLKQGIYQEPFEKELKTGAGKAGEIAGTVSVFTSTGKPLGAGKAGVTRVIDALPGSTMFAQFLKGAGGVAGRATLDALNAFGMSSVIEGGGDVEKAKQDGLITGAVSLVLGSVGSAYRGLKNLKATQEVLSRTSDIPSKAIDTVKQSGVDPNATPEKSLSQARKAVKQLRSDLSKEWVGRVDDIANEFNKQRMGLTDAQIEAYQKVIKEFGVNPNTIPQNLHSMSAKEALNMMKGLNELGSKAVTISPQGAIVRSLRPELKTSIINSFGGSKGSVAQLWSDYSHTKTIIDNADDIVKAFKGTPKATVTAKNNLMRIFDDNKDEFYNAIKTLEGETGTSIIPSVASTKFQSVLPGNYRGSLQDIASMVMLPLTSPKGIGSFFSPGATPGVSNLPQGLGGLFSGISDN